MKKILFFAAAAAFAFCSCEKPLDTQDKPDTDNKEPEVPEVVDSISVDPSGDEVTGDAAIFEVMVTSSSDWTMSPAAEYDWVTASADKGIDGDVVRFDVKENYEVDRTATFTFKVGEATADYTITSKAGVKVLPQITLLNSAEPVYTISQPYADSYVDVQIAAKGIFPDDFNVNIKEGADWLGVMVKQALAGGQQGDTQIYLQAKNQNDTGAQRTATVEISANGYETLVLTIHQVRLEKIELDHTSDVATTEARKFEVTVTSTSDWTLVPAAQYDWVTVSAREGKNGDKVTFEVTGDIVDGNTATFDFQIGGLKVTYSIVCKSASSQLTKIEVVRNKVIESYQEAPTNLVIRAEGITYEMVTAKFIGKVNWLSTPYVMPAPEPDCVEIYCSAYENLGKERTAELEISAPGCETLKVTLTQQGK